ncbi:hypothetical protein G6M24_25500 [Agrobacterium tumefaciens]|nr:hypothetical protein [Agrobacterium tumefaciens]
MNETTRNALNFFALLAILVFSAIYGAKAAFLFSNYFSIENGRSIIMWLFCISFFFALWFLWYYLYQTVLRMFKNNKR